MIAARHPASCAFLVALVAATVLNILGIISPHMLDMVFLASVGWMLFRLLTGRFGLVAAACAGLGTVIGLVMIQEIFPTVRYAPYLAVAPINLSLSALFARGLLPGREPVLLELVRIMGIAPVTDLGFVRFITGQCLLWSVLTLATAILAIAAMLDEPARPMIAGALMTLVIAQMIWFAVSHRYATYRYGRPETWLTTLRTLTRADVWPRLVSR